MDCTQKKKLTLGNKRGSRHQNLPICASKGDLHHDPISINTLEEILFQASLAIRTKQQY
jgi:hypothetical protein